MNDFNAHARMQELDEQFNFESMKGKPVYKKKGEVIKNLDLEQEKLVVIIEVREQRVFFQQLNNEAVKGTSAAAAFSQKYELCGFVD